MAKTDALLNLNVLSFNNNRAGNNSLNNNGNAAFGGAVDRHIPENQNLQNMFGPWHSALGAGLGFLSFFDRSSSSSPLYGYYPYYSYNYYPYYGGYRRTNYRSPYDYYPYYGSYRRTNYRSPYNYYPYYYYYRG
ncbi:hypothetical protein WUBG_08813 [Wuchereria bancrofti]|nr:hypothetical protein WUBG_08813 [Wuchereria bancrofti]